ncbi:MAG: alpha-mannosidase [Clostridia bacterium]|nr:alpha-mannosidase [Clostridia bacterium]
MDFIKEKIRIMVDKLNQLKLIEKNTIDVEYVECPEYKVTNEPPKEGWKPFPKGLRFEGIDNHYWVRANVKAQEPCENQEYRVSVKTGREGQWDSENPQCTVFIDGKTVQAMDTNHTWIPVESGRDYEIYFYVYTGMLGGDFCFEVSVDKVDLKIESLYYDINVPFMCLNELDAKSNDYIKIRDSLDKALMLLDLRHFYSEDFYKGIDATAKYLKDEFYGKICGKTEGVISCIGHTHIDVAWLWTVAQTREKAQRSFSTVLNLMKRYDDYQFMSSQPQLYQHVKEADPELYEEIKKRVKEGRWEVEGAMWLEADTNLISGESLVRQILYGKRFMREEFGVESKMLWLPDVFGYSGALPQILKKSGVPKFFTAKMCWNETNDMPNDTFIWEGIDGTSVFAVLMPGYVNELKPSALKSFWKQFKNKSITDNAILTYGWGDGGGGPTAEMLENYKRLKYGIPGIPMAKIEKASEYVDRTKESFEKQTAELKKTLKWRGEMYLEMHRGTYTSIAKNKKNNRKSELLYQEAETLSVADKILNGGEYPEAMFRKNITNILLNQFHDIIPGSSIKAVYDVTDAEYKVILGEGRKAADDKIANIKANLNTKGGIFVYNPAPFEMSGYVEADGKKYFAGNVPAHGWKVIADAPVDSGIAVSEKVIENDVIKVTFNDKYHIVSVFDKVENREVLAKNSEANVFEIFEDYPRAFDAWEITEYYVQKKWIADNVSGVELLENGIRIKRKYQESEFVQDIVLEKGSKRIDFITKIDWHEDHVLLKSAFPVDVHSVNATYDIQFGNVERPTHRNNSWDAAKFEVCAHKWADLSEYGYGVSILNDCKYGYSIEDNMMKITLLKSATYPNPEADRGMNEFTYSFYPHTGDFRKGGTVQEGYKLNMPLEASKVAAAGGKLPEEYSVMKSDCENVVIETIKKAEADDSIIVRLYESYNSKVNAIVTAGFDFKEVYLCDMMENNIEKLENDGRNVKLHVKNFEIVTLKFVL